MKFLNLPLQNYKAFFHPFCFTPLSFTLPLLTIKLHFVHKTSVMQNNNHTAFIVYSCPPLVTRELARALSIVKGENIVAPSICNLARTPLYSDNWLRTNSVKGASSWGWMKENFFWPSEWILMKLYPLITGKRIWSGYLNSRFLVML